jgi:hypothetical protein
MSKSKTSSHLLVGWLCCHTWVDSEQTWSMLSMSMARDFCDEAKKHSDEELDAQLVYNRLMRDITPHSYPFIANIRRLHFIGDTLDNHLHVLESNIDINVRAVMTAAANLSEEDDETDEQVQRTRIVLSPPLCAYQVFTLAARENKAKVSFWRRLWNSLQLPSVSGESSTDESKPYAMSSEPPAPKPDVSALLDRLNAAADSVVRSQVRASDLTPSSVLSVALLLDLFELGALRPDSFRASLEKARSLVANTDFDALTGPDLDAFLNLALEARNK